jgi:hypothetical protein
MSSGKWTIVIALYGAVVATASLIIAILAYRAGGPRLKPSTWLRPATEDKAAELTIRVANSGRAEGTVNRVYLSVPGPYSIPLNDPGILKGPELPCRVPGHASTQWTVEANWLLQEVRRNGWPHQVRAVIVLPAGQQIWQSIRRSTNLLSG